MLLFGRFHSVRVTDRQADGIAISISWVSFINERERAANANIDLVWAKAILGYCLALGSLGPTLGHRLAYYAAYRSGNRLVIGLRSCDVMPVNTHLTGGPCVIRGVLRVRWEGSVVARRRR